MADCVAGLIDTQSDSLCLQLRLAEAMASSVLLEPHVEEVVCILINSGHLPTPDEDGCLELDLR